jgi:ribosomal protein S18 acetylase RimI-like enzyme
MSLALRAARGDELGLVSVFVARLQEHPESRIPYFEELADEIAAEIESWGGDWPAKCLVAEREGRVVGFIGVEVDHERGRSWIYGPYAGDEEWDALAEVLLEEIVRVAGVEDVELLGEDAHARLGALAGRHGFSPGRVSLGLEIGRETATQLPDVVVSRLEERHQDAFVALHEALFPRTYYSGRQLAEQHAQGEAIVLTLVEDDGLVGYAVGRGKPGGVGYIDFLGVAEHARGRGRGRLLTTGICQALLDDPERSKLRLTVYEENAPAVALYERLGFSPAVRMVVYRRRP